MPLFDKLNINQLMQQGKPRLVNSQGGARYMGNVEGKARAPNDQAETAGAALGGLAMWMADPKVKRAEALQRYKFLAGLKSDAEREAVYNNPEVVADMEKNIRYLPELFKRDPSTGKIRIAKTLEGEEAIAGLEGTKAETAGKKAETAAVTGSEERAKVAEPTIQRGRKAIAKQEEVKADFAESNTAEDLMKKRVDLDLTVAKEDTERAQAAYIRKQMELMSNEAASKTRDPNIQKALDMKAKHSAELFGTYGRDLEGGPSFAFAMGDISSTTAVVKGLNKVESGTALTNPEMVGWINMSFDEGLRTLASRAQQEVPDTEMKQLYGSMRELYLNSYAITAQGYDFATKALSDPDLTREERDLLLQARNLHDPNIVQKLRVARFIAYRDTVEPEEVVWIEQYLGSLNQVDKPGWLDSIGIALGMGGGG